MAVLEKPSEKDKPLQLWVRTGTFAGDLKSLDIQVFAESRYVPADALKNALEKLPQEHPYTQPLSKRDVVLSSEQQEAIRPLMGRWEQVTREGQGHAFWEDCRDSSTRGRATTSACRAGPGGWRMASSCTTM
jgi:hypothetical protein